MIVFIKTKEVFIKKLLFPKLLPNSVQSPIISYKMAYTKITEN